MSEAPPRSIARVGLALGAVVAGGVAAALLWSAATVTSAPAPPIGSFAALLEAELREAGVALQSRTATLAELPRLGAAVATDEATARDLTDEELAFKPRAGEIVALAQLQKNGTATVLLTLPANRRLDLDFTHPGLTPIIDGDLLRLCDVAAVNATGRAGIVGGALAVCGPVALAPAVAALNQARANATLTVGATHLALSAGEGPMGPRVTQPMAGGKAQLEVALPVAEVPSPLLRPAAIAALLFALVVAGLVARRPRPGVAASTSAPAPGNESGSATGVQTPSPSSGPRAPSGSAPMVVPEGARQFGRYTLLKRLGVGGMAEVHLARVSGEAGFERLVALKLISPQMAADPLLVEHFLDEARLAARLNHPNIVNITDLGKADEQYYIAMEYVEGADLLHLIQLAQRRAQPIPPGVALRIISQVCAGLHAAHTAVDPDGNALELVHRDVKSANVFVARNGAVKVGDFGIAKANEAYRVRKTEVGQVKGTPAYMAPEHRMGHAVDRRSDEYGVGAVAYELLATRTIDLDMTRLAMLGREGWPHIPRLTAVRPDLPAELDQIVFRALAYERDARFADCALLEDAFEAVAAQHRWVENDRAVGKWVEEVLAWELATTDIKQDIA